MQLVHLCKHGVQMYFRTVSVFTRHLYMTHFSVSKCGEGKDLILGILRLYRAGNLMLDAVDSIRASAVCYSTD